MDLPTFLQQRRPEWRKLEEMLSRVEGSGLRGLSDDEAVEFGRLYRRAASDLNQAQTFVSGDETVGYLNQLVARGYMQVYSGRSRFTPLVWLKAAFLDYPRTMRRNMGFVLMVAGLFIAGLLLGIVVALNDAHFIEYLFPPGFQYIKPGRERETFDSESVTAMTGFYFANNVRVTLLAYALGFTLGVGTCWLVFVTALQIGALAVVFYRAEQVTSFCAELLPHGVVEIPAIIIGAASGLLLARGLIVARPWSRLDELARLGKESIRLVWGIVPLLAAAAVLEAAVARAPSWLLGNWLKLTVAAAIGLLFVAYIAFVGRHKPSATPIQTTDD